MGRASRAPCGPRNGTGLAVSVWIPQIGRGGAKGQTRTADRTIFSRELYQLSYLGAGRGPVRWAIEGSNLLPPRCKRGALPAELIARGWLRLGAQERI